MVKSELVTEKWVKLRENLQATTNGMNYIEVVNTFTRSFLVNGIIVDIIHNEGMAIQVSRRNITPWLRVMQKGDWEVAEICKGAEKWLRSFASLPEALNFALLEVTKYPESTTLFVRDNKMYYANPLHTIEPGTVEHAYLANAMGNRKQSQQAP